MRNITLLTGTMLFLPMTVMAQSINCTPSPDCASLGYTESSCPDGAGIKCPWGNTWFCTKEKCDTSFQYTCSGTGYAGGASEACNGKYQQCMCTSGYEWKNGACQKEILKPEWGKCNGYAQNCNIGDILYSDGTCSAQRISGKLPIAVVVYKSSDRNCGQAMALNSLGNYKWGKREDIPELNNFDGSSTASTDVQSCSNTALITAEGNKSAYPAAWAAHEYKTAGTGTGDWCLPAAGIMSSIKNNMLVINAGFTVSGGAKIETNSEYWSSSEFVNYGAWFSDFSDNYGLYMYFDAYTSKDHSYEVRPVIEF